MKTNHILLSIAAIILISFTACEKKYPDGPMIDFRSKTERVANNWKVGEVLENGNDVTADYNKYELDLTKGGEATLTAKYKVLGTDFEFSTNGTWVFVSNNEKISFDFENNNSDGVYKILRLKEDEMWLQNDAGTMEYHYVSR